VCSWFFSRLALSGRRTARATSSTSACSRRSLLRSTVQSTTELKPNMIAMSGTMTLSKSAPRRLAGRCQSDTCVIPAHYRPLPDRSTAPRRNEKFRSNQ